MWERVREWVRRNYSLLMIGSMLLELAMLGWIAWHTH